MQPVGLTQGNVRVQVDLPAGLMLININAQVDVGLTRSNAHVRVYLQSVDSMQSNMHARADMQPANSTQENARA